MKIDKSIKEVIEKVFEKNSRTLLYRDYKQLKNEDYREVANRMLNKYSKLYLFYLSFVAILFIIGGYYLAQFVSGSGRGDFYLFAAYSLFAVMKLFFVTREFYSIKSSLSVVFQLLDAGKTVKEHEPAGQLNPANEG